VRTKNICHNFYSQTSSGTSSASSWPSCRTTSHRKRSAICLSRITAPWGGMATACALPAKQSLSRRTGLASSRRTRTSRRIRRTPSFSPTRPTTPRTPTTGPSSKEIPSKTARSFGNLAKPSRLVKLIVLNFQTSLSFNILRRNYVFYNIKSLSAHISFVNFIMWKKIFIKNFNLPETSTGFQHYYLQLTNFSSLKNSYLHNNEFMSIEKSRFIHIGTPHAITVIL